MRTRWSNEKLCCELPCPHDLLCVQDPKVYVQTILDVHKKYNALVMTAFNNDAGFVAALDKVRACTHHQNSSHR